MRPRGGGGGAPPPSGHGWGGGPARASHNVSVKLAGGGRNAFYVPFFGTPASGGGPQTADLVVSHDGGQTWTRRSDPCANDPRAENGSSAIAAAAGGVVASVCNPRQEN